jgi:hypothetical protein
MVGIFQSHSGALSWTLAPPSARIETRHARGDAAFVKEDQFLRRDGAKPLDELFPPPLVFFCVPLGGME